MNQKVLQPQSREWFFLLMFFLMNCVGLGAYWAGATYYRTPSDEALIWIALANLMVLLGWAGNFLYVKHGRKYHVAHIASKKNKAPTKPIALLFFWCALLIIFSYVAILKENFILYKVFTSIEIRESDRPDVAGGVPFYYTFTLILNSLTVPLLVNYVSKTYREAGVGLNFLLAVSALVLCSLLIGDKSSILGIVFYFVFMNGGRIGLLKIFFFLALFVGFYGLGKMAYGAGSSAFASDYIIESIFRRVSMIQVSAMGVVIDQLIVPGDAIPYGFNHLKQYVFYAIYGYVPGGAPVPYAVHLMYVTRAGLLLLPIIPFITFILFRLRALLVDKTAPQFRVANSYLMFYGAIVLGSGSVVDFSLRCLIPAFMIMLASRLVSNKYVGNINTPAELGRA